MPHPDQPRAGPPGLWFADGVDAPGEIVGPALLPDMRLAPSPPGAPPDLVPDRGCVVEGVLYRPAPDAALLAAYHRTTRYALREDGSCLPVTTIERRPELRTDTTGPAPAPLHDLFVYGTLLPGESNHHLLAREITEPGRPATIRGTLHDLGSYPALSLDGHGEVHGQLYRLPNPRNAFIPLDELEQAAPQGAPDGPYRRTILPVREGARSTRAWVYVKDGPIPGPVIPHGSWVARLRP